MAKVRKIRKPRAAHVNAVLMTKKCGVHEPKVGEHAKRARQKRNARKEMQKQLSEQ